MELEANDWKKKTDISNLLKEAANLFVTRIRDGLPGAYAEQLIHLPEKAVKLGIQEIARNAGDKFPSLNDIKKTCWKYIEEDQKDDKEKEHRKKFNAEAKRFKDLYDKFFKLVGEEALERYYNYWCKEFIGFEGMSKLSGLGLDSKAFMKCAIFDLAEANGDPKFAIKIMKRKKEANGHKLLD